MVDVADWIEQTAALHDAPATGNPDFAAALRRAAKLLRRNGISATTSQKIIDRTPKPPKSGARKKSLSERAPTPRRPSAVEYRNMEISQIRKFIEDESKTKKQLLELAAERFSIPTSQLQKLAIVEIRRRITSALLHEDSIEILSTEASRGTRSS
ncbi:hypothetical protein [Burkholderia lata]|uniref:hypothetical protein n=1 Tax=Burkholderia lata (strain ATCC 17760 / DSM 23089 / LMG 22485 / NCIMB 9086 / R18194 / 383) TaxID=482957 RepID=UPI001584439D|nr:hypothetical protein [Burkholderia lata]